MFSQHKLLHCSIFISRLTHIEQKTHQCLLSTVAADGLVFKHQAMSIHSSD